MIPVTGRQLQRETVAAEARENVQMDVRDLLSGLLAVCQEQVHSLALKPAGSAGLTQGDQAVKKVAAVGYRPPGQSR